MLSTSQQSNLFKELTLFSIGGIIYYVIEFIYKTFISQGNIHWTMFILGGLCFLLVGFLNEFFTWDMSLTKQGIIGTIIITFLEFIFGCVLNIWLQLNIWDYSQLPLNILGQVSLSFCCCWFVLSIVAVILDDYLRYWLFKEQKPTYKII